MLQIVLFIRLGLTWLPPIRAKWPCISWNRQLYPHTSSNNMKGTALLLLCALIAETSSFDLPVDVPIPDLGLSLPIPDLQSPECSAALQEFAQQSPCFEGTIITASGIFNLSVDVLNGLSDAVTLEKVFSEYTASDVIQSAISAFFKDLCSQQSCVNSLAATFTSCFKEHEDVSAYFTFTR